MKGPARDPVCAKALDLYRKGKTCSQIARELQRSINTVESWIRRHGRRIKRKVDPAATGPTYARGYRW